MQAEITEFKLRIGKIENHMKVNLTNGETKQVPLGKAIEEIWYYTAGLRFIYKMSQFLDAYPGLKRPVRTIIALMVASFIYSIFSVPIKDIIKWIN